MADVEKKSKEDLEFDIFCEKRAKKIILICTAICCGLGLIIGLIAGISEGGVEYILAGFFGGIWFGTGLGGAVSLIPSFWYAHKEAQKRGDEGSFGMVLIGFLFFVFVGLLGFLIRILRINSRIKKFENQLSALV